MVRIAPVALQYNPRTLWFDPGELDLADGDAVVVRMEKGLEFGHARGIVDVDESELARLKSKLKPVVRKATEEDVARVDDLRQKGKDALPVFKRLAAQSNKNMRPVMVEYAFDGDRAVFFFEAEERVDFRDLVRKLASELHVRVDMRQIGVRDEARMVGGIGHCGQELCCRRLGGEFCPVSIRMAKEQDLSLNPQKISGVCGRLMCCLRYEYDAYKDFKSRAPKVNAKVETPRGEAKVTNLNVPKEEVTVRIEEDGKPKQVTFPLSAMDAPAEDAPSKRPTSIGAAFEEYADPDPFATSQATGLFDTAGFTGDDKLAKPEAHHNPTRTRKRPAQGRGVHEGEGHTHRKPRHRRGSVKGGAAPAADGASAKASAAPTGGKRSEAKKGEGARRSTRKRSARPSAADASAVRGPAPSKGNRPAKGGPRPGQKSSALRAARSEAASGDARPAIANAQGINHRRRRRRRSTQGGSHDSEAKE